MLVPYGSIRWSLLVKYSFVRTGTDTQTILRTRIDAHKVSGPKRPLFTPRIPRNPGEPRLPESVPE